MRQSYWSRWVRKLLTQRRAPVRHPRLQVEQLECKIQPNAVPIGPQFMVTETLGPSEIPPAVAIIDSAPGQGDFIAVWQSYGEDGDGFGIFAQIFDQSGDAVLAEPFLVNTTTPGNQMAPTVASDGAGHFVIGWQGEDRVDGGYDIFALQGSYLGTTLTLGSETQLNTDADLLNGLHRSPSAAMDAGGEFVVAWETENIDTLTGETDAILGFDIHARQGTLAGFAAGDEFLVNTENQTGNQLTPSAAMGSSVDSNFLIAWQGTTPVVGDEEASVEIFGKLYASDGTVLENEFQVNVSGGHDKVDPFAAMNASGEFVVAWQAEGASGSGADVFARRFDANADPIDPGEPNLLLNQTIQRPQRAPTIGIDDDGNFLAAWQSNLEDGFSWGIFARRFDATTETFGDQFVVNNLIVSGPQTSPAVAVTGDGRTVVIWTGPEVPEHGEETEEGEGGHLPAVHARRFINTGATAMGSEFLLDTYVGLEDLPAATAADASGNYVVVWQSWEDIGDESGFGIYAKLFHYNGAPIDLNGNGLDDDTMLVNTITLGSQSSPSVAMDAAGNFTVVWQSPVEVAPGVFVDQIQARQFNAYLQEWASAAEFLVSEDASVSQTNPEVAMDGAGNFTIVWEEILAGVEDPDGSDILGRQFAADGTPLGAEFAVNTVLATEQFSPSISMNAAGEFVVAWVSDHNVESDEEDTEKSIFARWFNASGVALQPEVLLHTYTKDAQEHPSVAIEPDGDFVAVWQSINQERNLEGIGQTWGVYARQFTVSDDGVITPVQDNEFRVNTTADGSQRYPTVAVNQYGEFVVTWQTIRQDESSWAVFGRQYAANGTAEGPEQQINTFGEGPQIQPVIAPVPTGDFAIIWSGLGPDHTEGVYGQRFNWIRDDFNRGGNFPSLGPDWTVRLGNYDIHDDMAAVVSTNAFATLNNVSLRDVTVEGYVTLGGGLTQVQGLVARHQGPGNQNMYFGRLVGEEGNFRAQIWRNLNGEWTRLATSAVDVGEGLLRFEVVGSSLKLFLNGELVVWTYDGAIPNAGRIGMRGTTDTTLDNFTYTPIAALPAQLPLRDTFNMPDGFQLSRFWLERTGNFSALNNRLVANDSLNLAALNTANVANVAVEAIVDVTGGKNAGVIARYQGTGDRNMYRAALVNTGGAFTAEISKNVGGVWTRLTRTTVASGTGLLRFETEGNALRLFLDNVLINSTTDNAFSSGLVGIRSSAGTTADEFRAEAIV